MQERQGKLDPFHLGLLVVGVLVVAFLYSSVGHAGASGYIAVMSLLGLAPEYIRPTALVLNIFVASITFWQFFRAGYFSWNLFWPFALLSIPLALTGGYIRLPAHWFGILVGIVLFFSAARLLVHPSENVEIRTPNVFISIAVGGLLGLVAGLTGTGGGIFLTPLLVFMRWARVRTAGAMSALFILVNSIFGLAGNLTSTRTFPDFAWILAGVVVVGGTGGSYMGSRRFDPVILKRILAVVLVIAGLKMVFTR